jgi:hypothetical protein
MFSPENGSLTKAALTWDWSKELTYYYIGDGGHTSSHNVQSGAASDGRATANHWNRIETYIGSDEKPDAVLDEVGQGILEGAKPKIILNAQTVDTLDIKYGIHYFYGDSVWVQASGFLFLCHIHSIKNRVSDGKENLVVNLKGEISATS